MCESSRHRENVFTVTATGQELSALVAGARLALDAMRASPDAPATAVELLGRVLEDLIGPESDSPRRRRTATGADSQEPGRSPETGQAGAPAAIWERTCVVTWSNSSTNWS